MKQPAATEALPVASSYCHPPNLVHDGVTDVPAGSSQLFRETSRRRQMLPAWRELCPCPCRLSLRQQHSHYPRRHSHPGPVATQSGVSPCCCSVSVLYMTGIAHKIVGVTCVTAHLESRRRQSFRALHASTLLRASLALALAAAGS